VGTNLLSTSTINDGVLSPRQLPTWHALRMPTRNRRRPRPPTLALWLAAAIAFGTGIWTSIAAATVSNRWVDNHKVLIWLITLALAIPAVIQAVRVGSPDSSAKMPDGRFLSGETALGARDPEDFEPKYDVCLSYAGEQRAYVDAVARELRYLEIRVFYDSTEKGSLWGKDLDQHLDRIYRYEARFCVMFLSTDYARKAWPSRERRSAQARALEQGQEYILPVRFDDVEIPGISESLVYLDVREGLTPAELATLVQDKLRTPLKAERVQPDTTGREVTRHSKATQGIGSGATIARQYIRSKLAFKRNSFFRVLQLLQSKSFHLWNEGRTTLVTLAGLAALAALALAVVSTYAGWLPNRTNHVSLQYRKKLTIDAIDYIGYVDVDSGQTLNGGTGTSGSADLSINADGISALNLTLLAPSASDGKSTCRSALEGSNADTTVDMSTVEADSGLCVETASRLIAYVHFVRLSETSGDRSIELVVDAYR
jgi:hypothetical protein